MASMRNGSMNSRLAIHSVTYTYTKKCLILALKAKEKAGRFYPAHLFLSPLLLLLGLGGFEGRPASLHHTGTTGGDDQLEAVHQNGGAVGVDGQPHHRLDGHNVASPDCRKGRAEELLANLEVGHVRTLGEPE